jgi:hypothetical protein
MRHAVGNPALGIIISAVMSFFLRVIHYDILKWSRMVYLVESHFPKHCLNLG